MKDTKIFKYHFKIENHASHYAEDAHLKINSKNEKNTKCKNVKNML